MLSFLDIGPPPLIEFFLGEEEDPGPPIPTISLLLLREKFAPMAPNAPALLSKCICYWEDWPPLELPSKYYGPPLQWWGLLWPIAPDPAFTFTAMRVLVLKPPPMLLCNSKFFSVIYLCCIPIEKRLKSLLFKLLLMTEFLFGNIAPILALTTLIPSFAAIAASALLNNISY